MSTVDKTLSFLTTALGQSDSRDSLTEVMQYSARLMAGTCPSQELAARRVYKSLSEGRKVFRLFRFIPELRQLRTIEDPDPLIQGLTVAQSSFAFLFYALDNWIYLLETVKRKSRGDIRPVKHFKNRISLLRILIAITLTIAELKREFEKSADLTFSRMLGQDTDSEDEKVTRWRFIVLTVRFWHETLRLWLTLHKLHILSQFLLLPPKKTVALITVNRREYDVVPGAVGLASALTGLFRRTVLRNLVSSGHS